MKNYQDIFKALRQLLERNGTLGIATSNFYYQIFLDYYSDTFYVESVSEYYCEMVGDKKEDFKKLGYKIEKETNYFKYVQADETGINLIINDIDTIFNDIYNEPLENYSIHSNYYKSYFSSIRNVGKYTIWGGLVIAVLIIIGSLIPDNPLEHNKTYYLFNEGNYGIPYIEECIECDDCWGLKFNKSGEGEIWSFPCSEYNVSLSLISCRSTLHYSYDKSNRTIKVKSITNPYVSSLCRNWFIGEWKWKEGINSYGFYSKNNSTLYFNIPALN